MKNEERFRFYVAKLREALKEMQKIVVGQKEMLECLLISLIINGHTWLEGPPGVGKTLGARTFAKILDIDSKGIQFTPDLLPSDLKIAVDLLSKSDSKESEAEGFSLLKKFVRGKVFTNYLRIDEGNRAPQKVQAALLEVMQEREVTMGAETISLDRPYIVTLTTNPIEHEGTYSLSEALADRFNLKAKLEYPDFEEECKIATRRRAIESDKIEIRKIFSKEEIVDMQDLFFDSYHFEPESQIVQYAVNITRVVRDFSKQKFVSYGPTPRGSSDLLVAASALAMIEGATDVGPDRIKRMALPALRGTFNITTDAEAKELDHDKIIKMALEKVKVVDEVRK